MKGSLKMNDKDLMLFQALLIYKLRDEITHTLSLMPQMSKDVRDKIFEKHICGYDSMALLCEILERHFPKIYSRKEKSIRQMFEEGCSYLDKKYG